MDFTQSMDNGYMIPTSVAVGSGEATDIRCVCDTVEDFKSFLDATDMELRYEGLVTYEKVNKLLKVYKGNDTWQTVGEGGGGVDTSSFITLTQLSQQLSNYYTKAQTDNKISEEIAKAQLGESGEGVNQFNLLDNVFVNTFDNGNGEQVPPGDNGNGEQGEYAITPVIDDFSDFTSNTNSSANFLLDYPLQNGRVSKVKLYCYNKTSIYIYIVRDNKSDGWNVIERQLITPKKGAGFEEIELNLNSQEGDRIVIQGGCWMFTWMVAESNMQYLDLNERNVLNVGETFTSKQSPANTLTFGACFYGTNLTKKAKMASLSDNEFVLNNCSTNNGLHCSDNSMAYFNKYLTFDTYNLRSKVTLKDNSAKFGLMCKHSQKGALYLIDLTSRTISLHSQYNGSFNIPAVKASTSLNIPINVGEDYIIEVKKTGWKHTFSITRVVTGEVNSVEFDNSTQSSSDSYCGKGWGSPGVICFNGSVKFKNLIYNVANFKNPKALIIGDSITEGTNMGAGVDIKYRYSSLIRDNIYSGKAMICGRGGDNSAGVIERLNNLYSIGFFSPITIVLIGTNERGNVQGWKNNIDNIVSLIKSNNSIPVICTPPACVSNFDAIKEMRDYINLKNYNTIRFDISTTANKDGENCASELFTDGVHPNKEGSIKMFEQAKIELGMLI